MMLETKGRMDIAPKKQIAMLNDEENLRWRHMKAGVDQHTYFQYVLALIRDWMAEENIKLPEIKTECELAWSR